jgi:hypothetical protein
MGHLSYWGIYLGFTLRPGALYLRFATSHGLILLMPHAGLRSPHKKRGEQRGMLSEECTQKTHKSGHYEVAKIHGTTTKSAAHRSSGKARPYSIPLYKKELPSPGGKPIAV